MDIMTTGTNITDTITAMIITTGAVITTITAITTGTITKGMATGITTRQEPSA